MSDLPFPEEDPLQKDIHKIVSYYLAVNVSPEAFEAAIKKLLRDYGERTPNSVEVNNSSDHTVPGIPRTGHSELDTSLMHVTNSIEYYSQNDNIDGDTLCGLLQTITAHVYFLQVFRSGYHMEYNRIMHEFPGAVSKAKLLAEAEVPELYLLRRVIDASKGVTDAIRSQLSAMKYELTNTK
jgi:hypothetical protein